MGDPITVYPIGVVSGGGGQIFGDHRGTVVSRLVPGPAGVDPDAALGLGGFSRIEVVFHDGRPSPRVLVEHRVLRDLDDQDSAERPPTPRRGHT